MTTPVILVLNLQALLKRDQAVKGEFIIDTSRKIQIKQCWALKVFRYLINKLTTKPAEARKRFLQQRKLLIFIGLSRNLISTNLLKV